MQRGPPEALTPGLQFSVSIPPYGGFRRRPQRPGTSSLDMNRNSPGDSPSRKSPATLNSGRQRLETFSRFDCVALCPRPLVAAIANFIRLVQKLWSRIGSCGKGRKSRTKIHRPAKIAAVLRSCSPICAPSSVLSPAPRSTITPMIAHLRGILLAKHPNQATVETYGVGYDVNISVPTFSEMPSAGSEVALHIHTHVREDALSLYGFFRLAEKHLFEKLLTVSGIGPKLAITILSGMPADEMVTAIRGGDLVRLTRIPGIGKKTAERMVLELRDKLPATTGAAEVSSSTATPVEEDVISALVNLGYQRANAEKALLAARGPGSPAAPRPQTFDALFRNALGSLSK